VSYPLRRPEPPATFSASDYANEVVLVVIGGYHPEIKTRDYGVKPAMRVSIVMLTGRTAGTVYEDVMLFGAKQSSQFRDMQGGDVVLSRIVKNGKAIVFDPGSAYDEQQAGVWIQGNAARLEQLRADAVRNFQEQCQRMREDGTAPPNGYMPAASPQFVAPAAQPSLVDTVPAGGHPVVAAGAASPNATVNSLRSPGEPATAEEAGY
jgi:hypothetical protein